MTPYVLLQLYSSVAGANSKKFPKSQTGFYLVQSKQALANLRKLNWEDNDISFFVTQAYDLLKAKQMPTSFEYLCAILKKMNKTPQLVVHAGATTGTSGIEDWLNQEINFQKTRSMFL
jgi:hypothetical protein